MTERLQIQTLDENQTQRLRPLMRQAFGFFGNLMAYDVGKKTFMATQGETLMGAVVCGEIRASKKKTFGIIKYIMTDPNAQGLGVAQRLMDEAMVWFESRNHAQIIACVEGYNTASSQLFEKRGFSVKSFPWQLKRYGWRLPIIWVKANHGLDLGHFWWVKTRDEPSVKTTVHSLINAFLHLFVSLLLPSVFVLRQRGPWTPALLWQGAILVSLLFLVRFLPMVVYALSLIHI